MKIAVSTSFFAKWYMDVNPGHSAKVIKATEYTYSVFNDLIGFIVAALYVW